MSLSIVMMIITLCITLGLLFFVFSKIKSLYKTREKVKDDFIRNLDKKFDFELISDKYDIVLLKNSVERMSDSDYSLISLLEDYLLHLNDISDNKIEKDRIKQRYSIVKQIVEKENQEKPFSEAPEEERRLLVALRDAMSNKDEEAMSFNMEELSNTIIVRHKLFNKSIRTNKWSVPLAIIGLVTSLLLGILSISRSIDYKKIDHIIKENISNTNTSNEQPIHNSNK